VNDAGAKSRSSFCSPLLIDDAAPPPKPMSIAGPPRTIILLPTGILPWSS
jgi:hypothetical protein